MIAIIAIVGCLALGRVRGRRRHRADARQRAVRWRSTRTGVRTGSSRACSTARRSRSTATNGGAADPAIDEVRPGDRLLREDGRAVPVDGVLEADAVLDESALTGESRPVERPDGRARSLGRGERRTGLRPARDHHGRRQHVRRHRAAGRGRREGRRRPRCAWPTATRSCSSRSRLAIAGVRMARRPATRMRAPGCPRRRHAVPVDPGGADRDRRRHLARRPSAASS